MYYRISADELSMVTDAKIIDIRDKDSYTRGHIPKAINIPMIDLIERPSEYLDKKNNYYLYCQFGVNSKELCLILSNDRYSVTDIIDGYKGYLTNLL